MVSGDCGGTGRPSSTSRLLTAIGVAWLSWRKLAVTVDVSAILIRLGLATLVSTMNGSNVVVNPPTILMVPAAEFVPHQLFVAITVPPALLRLLPEGAMFPAS